MGTVIKPELSEKNPYWIEKHRFLELRQFCLQYPIWKRAYISLDGLPKAQRNFGRISKTMSVSNPTEKIGIAKEFYSRRMDMVKMAAKETDESLAEYILEGVTTGCSYDSIKARLDIPCCRDVYYENYRKFFWVLNRIRE